MVEHKIPFCPSEPAHCPVLALFTYVKLCKDLDIATYIDHESSIWLGTTAGRNGGKKCYVTLSSSEPIAKDTLVVMTAAGIDDLYKAHALRSVVATKHIDAGASELDRVAFARWSSTYVFRKFYARTKAKLFSVADIMPAAVQEALLAPASPVEAPAKLAPRLNLLGPRGGQKSIPGTQWSILKAQLRK
jgi:hypothetical protein